MTDDAPHNEDPEDLSMSKWKRGEIRPLTTDERAWFVILSVYMSLFGLCTFVYWDSLLLTVLGVTSIAGGLVLFIAAFFNTEAPEKSNSLHPVRSYLLSLGIALSVLFVIRFTGGLISNLVLALAVLYGGLLLALVVFRKALVQVIATLLATVFLFVTVSNWNAVLVGHVKFNDTVRLCGQLIFRIGPIQDVINLLLTGNYMGYLSRIDYRDKQINIMAVRTVADSNDNEVRKTKAILDFVSNEIYYVSDPDDGVEYAKDPITTLIAGGGDCEDQTLLLCSMLESVGVKTYIAFTDDHVFALVRFKQNYKALGVSPHLFIDGVPCYALDAANPEAKIGGCSSAPVDVTRVFDVREKAPMRFSIDELI